MCTLCKHQAIARDSQKRVLANPPNCGLATVVTVMTVTAVTILSYNIHLYLYKQEGNQAERCRQRGKV